MPKQLSQQRLRHKESYYQHCYALLRLLKQSQNDNIIIIKQLRVNYNAGLEITAGQRTMSRLIGELTGQPFVLPVMLTGHI